jgi:hypothetical protein
LLIDTSRQGDFVNRWHQIACFIFLGFVLAGCDTVSATKVEDIPKTTSTPAPTMAAKVSPAITETVFPFVEETPTLQPEVLAEVATLDAIVTEMPELGNYYDRFCIIHGNCAYVSNLGLSPNKEWAVFFSVENGTGGLSIVNVASKKQWQISYYDITGESCCDTTVVIEHWSHDGNYIYVSPRMAASGGLFWFWRDHIQLIRINLEHGAWVDTKMGSSYSFSPNDKFIAYRRGATLVIYEFQTGNERILNIPTEYVAFGRFTWSQDSKQIIFVGSTVQELQTDEGKPNGFT